MENDTSQKLLQDSGESIFAARLLDATQDPLGSNCTRSGLKLLDPSSADPIHPPKSHFPSFLGKKLGKSQQNKNKDTRIFLLTRTPQIFGKECKNTQKNPWERRQNQKKLKWEPRQKTLKKARNSLQKEKERNQDFHLLLKGPRTCEPKRRTLQNPLQKPSRTLGKPFKKVSKSMMR